MQENVKYLGCVVNENGIDDNDVKMMQSRKVEGAIKAIDNTKRLSLERLRLLHESMLVAI